MTGNVQFNNGPLMRFIIVSAFAFLASATGASKGAELYPLHAIKLIIPAPVGGGADLSFRILAQGMEAFLGQKIEIENNPNDAAAAGLAKIAKAAPDGYTLGAAWNGPLTAAPQMRKLPYKLDSFAPIASTFESDYVLCAKKEFPANNGPELISLLNAGPLAYSYGNEGKGGGGYFAAELLFEDLGVLLRSESYDGSVDVAKNFAAGKVDFYFGTTSAIIPLVKAGTAKCLITLSNSKLDAFAGSSTLNDIGVPAHQSSLWRLVLAPKGTPKDRLAKVEEAIRKAIGTPAMQTFLAAKGERTIVLSGVQTSARLKAEYDTFANVADRLGLKSE